MNGWMRFGFLWLVYVLNVSSYCIFALLNHNIVQLERCFYILMFDDLLAIDIDYLHISLYWTGEVIGCSILPVPLYR